MDESMPSITLRINSIDKTRIEYRGISVLVIRLAYLRLPCLSTRRQSMPSSSIRESVRRLRHTTPCPPAAR